MIQDTTQNLPSSGRSGISLLWPVLALFLWPFIYLFPYTFNLIGFGNDFNPLYYNYKVYLLDGLSRFRVPLWSPSEAGGFPFYSNPFVQLLYPFNAPLAAVYRITGGYTQFDHQLFTIFGISLFAVGLFLWLRALRLPLRPALFAAFVMSVSFKVTEIVRFPNAVHTMAWFPWILLTMHLLFTSTTAKRLAVYGLLHAFFVFCLLTGGYPYYLYYSLFLFIPYALMYFIPAVRPAGPVDWKRSLSALAAATAAPVLACAPYLLRIAGLMAQTSDRTGRSFLYSTEKAFTPGDTIGSLVYPLAAQAEGWYYFGILGVLLLMLYVFGSRKDGGSRSSSLPLKLFFVLWAALISYITYGKNSYLFIFLWNHLPFFSSLRIWGRMNIILVPVLAWMLAYAYTHFERLLFSPDTPRSDRSRNIVIAAAGFAVILAVQLYCFSRGIFDEMWSYNFTGPKALAVPEIKDLLLTKFGAVFIAAAAVSFLFVLFLLLRARPGKAFTPRARRIVLFSCIAISCLDTFSTGPWMWTSMPKRSTRASLDVPALAAASFRVPRKDVYATISLDSAYNAGMVDNWYFARYYRFRLKTQGDREAYQELMGMKDGRKLYFSRSISHETVRGFLNDAAAAKNFANVRSYDGDTLVADIRAPSDGFVSFIDNWDRDWKAFVDGKPARIELLFGTFKSVSVPAGEHTVAFAYEPGLLSFYKNLKN